MRIGMLGTGMVGRVIATKLVALGHEVMMGSRTAGNEKAAGWVSAAGLGEQIQRACPDARVVKTLNTVNCEVMVDPARVPGEHDVFGCGNDAAAKAEVAELLRTFGWPEERIVDLGDISAARGREAYALLWVRLRGVAATNDSTSAWSSSHNPAHGRGARTDP